MFVTNNIPARPMEGERERREMVSGMRKFGAQAGKHHRALSRSQGTSRAWVVLTHYCLVGPQLPPRAHIVADQTILLPRYNCPGPKDEIAACYKCNLRFQFKTEFEMMIISQSLVLPR